ncbi:MAG: hypothetical protein ACREBW_07320 [Candidatus Micrarchaeaceae archaeon]
MNRFNKFLVAAFMSAAMLLPTMVQAMEIQQYDKMALQDQNDYTIALIDGAQKVMIDEGRSDLAEQVHTLFTETPAGDAAPLGVTEFESNLDLARVADAKRVVQDPNAHRLEVEDAMLVTLKKNNIPLSQDFIRDFRVFNNGFHPKLPPQQ